MILKRSKFTFLLFILFCKAEQLQLMSSFANLIDTKSFSYRLAAVRKTFLNIVTLPIQFPILSTTVSCLLLFIYTKRLRTPKKVPYIRGAKSN